MGECDCEWYKEHNERKQGDFMTKKLFLIFKVKWQWFSSNKLHKPKKLKREVYTKQQNQAKL